MAGSTVAPLWRVNHICAMIMSDRYRIVGRAVIDNDRPDAGRHPTQHPVQRFSLVEARQYDLDLGPVGDHAQTLFLRRHRSADSIAFGSLTPSCRANQQSGSGNPFLPRLLIMAARVLVVEDDATMAEVLRAYLSRAGYQVEWSGDGTEALQLWQRISPDVVVLDIMLPGLSGLEVLRRRRRSGDHARVIMLSARGEEEDRLLGLETGADDYVVKPFSPREVVLRVEALLRRTEGLAGTQLVNSTVTLGPVTIDSAAREARRSGRLLALTMREFDLLAFLASHSGETFSKDQLLRRVWGWDFGDTSTVTVHVRRLREKLERDPSDPRLVLTVGRFGYRMAREDELVGEDSRS
jgi:DNA-binding response OmpR family regulator